MRYWQRFRQRTPPIVAGWMPVRPLTRRRPLSTAAARPRTGGTDRVRLWISRALSTTTFARRTGTRNGDLMDFFTASQHAIGGIEAGPEPDSDPVRIALQLAVYAWQTCEPEAATAINWDMFGNGLCAAIDEIGQPPAPFVIVVELPMPDTAQVRRQTAALTTVIAAHLEAASSDPQHATDLRWAWATAAARLRTAASDLVAWP